MTDAIAVRLDEIQARAEGTSPEQDPWAEADESKLDVLPLVAAVRAVLQLADVWEKSAQAAERDHNAARQRTLRSVSRGVFRAIASALGVES